MPGAPERPGPAGGRRDHPAPSAGLTIARGSIRALAVDGGDLVGQAEQGPFRLGLGAGEALKWKAALEKPLPTLAKKMELSPGMAVWTFGTLDGPELESVLAGSASVGTVRGGSGHRAGGRAGGYGGRCGTGAVAGLDRPRQGQGGRVRRHCGSRRHAGERLDRCEVLRGVGNPVGDALPKALISRCACARAGSGSSASRRRRQTSRAEARR